MKNKVFLLLLIYLIIGSLLYCTQNLFLFHPKKLASNYLYNTNLNHNEYFIKWNNNKDQFNYLHFKPVISKGVVLFFHGNQDNISNYLQYPDFFLKNEYEVFIMEYPGFGKSTNNCNTNNLQQCSLLFYDSVIKNTNMPIIIYGKSLGTGIASNLASQRQNSSLVLETPYLSTENIFYNFIPILPTKLIIKDSLNNMHIKKVIQPITILHGTDDGVIPYFQTIKLKAYLKPLDKFYTFNNTGHLNVYQQSNYLPIIDSICNSLIKNK